MEELNFHTTNYEKAKPLRIQPSIRIGGFRKQIFTFVHYHPRLLNDDVIQCIFYWVKIFSTNTLRKYFFIKEEKSKIKGICLYLRCELCHKKFSGIMRRHNYKNIMNRNHNEPKIEAYDSSQAREEGCGAQCGLGKNRSKVQRILQLPG